MFRKAAVTTSLLIRIKARSIHSLEAPSEAGDKDDRAFEDFSLSVRAVIVALLVMNLAACATASTPPHQTAGPMEGAIAQPFKDLGLVRENAEGLLLQAAASPYAVDDRADCAALAASIAQLEEILGPDVDVVAQGGDSIGSDIVSGAIRSALGLPFRGVMRRISGAEARDRLRARAVLAGMVRRGFLKGLVRAVACP